MGRRTYIETVAVAWTFMSRQSEERAYIEGGRVNAHEEVLLAQQDLSSTGSMKKGGVFITGEFTVSPVPRAPASPWDRKRT